MLENPIYWGDLALNVQGDRVIRDWWTVVRQIDGFWDAGEIAQERIKRAGRHGTVSMDAFYGSKPITLSGEIRARNLTSLRTGQRELQKHFRSLESKLLRFHLWDEEPVEGMARKVQVFDMPEVQADGRYARGFVIGLMLDDPYLYGESWNSQIVAVGGTLLSTRSYSVTGSGPRRRTYDQPGPTRIYTSTLVPDQIVNEGTVESYPIIVLKGPMTNPTIVNQTSGKTVVWDDLIIAADETYRVDMGEGEVHLNSVIETYDGLDVLGSEFWALEPGENEIALIPFSSGPGADMTVYWRSAFG